MTTLRTLFLATAITTGAFAQVPNITSIQNPASNILPGLPNFGIAQGQIFVLYGTNLGPATLVQPTALPWPNSFAGTSIQIVGIGDSTVYNAPIIYTVATQVAAVMPSGVPVGQGATVQVIYNGVPGNIFTTKVVDSNFGISTADQTGTGGAVITDANYTVLTTSSPAKPGTTYTMWGTGLGAANSDNNLATNGDLHTDLQVLVGGVSAPVTYRGRSGAPGLDQINFTIPSAVLGCRVSLAVMTNTTPIRISNIVTIPIATNGGACSDTDEVSTTSMNAAIAAKGSAALAYVKLDGNQKQASAWFLRFNAAQWTKMASRFNNNSLGSCTTSITSGSVAASGLPDSTGLNAGSAAALTQPGGAILPLPFVQPGVFAGTLASVLSGSYVLANGFGGVDVAAANIPFNGPPPFVWSNSGIFSVTRSAGLPIAWSGGDANSYVVIGGSAPAALVIVNGIAVQPSTTANFVCMVPAAPGSFTVPASVLLAMPTTFGTVSVSLNTNPQNATVPGTDAAVVVTNTSVATANVSYQ